MTLGEVLAHLDGPVLAAVAGTGKIRSGEIERVDTDRQLVLVRLRRTRAPYDFTQKAWYAPCHLRIPEWWHVRKAAMELAKRSPGSTA
jgi:hypothetical protein